MIMLTLKATELMTCDRCGLLIAEGQTYYRDNEGSGNYCSELCYHKSLIDLCEMCDENQGATNSGYWKDEDNDTGHWVCWACEEKLHQSHQEYLRDMATVYTASDSND